MYLLDVVLPWIKLRHRVCAILCWVRPFLRSQKLANISLSVSKIHHWNTSVTFIGSDIKRTDSLKPDNVYVIVHGQTNLMTEVIAKLVLKGFKEENIKMARLDMAGNIGDYVAMVWPPGRPQEIIVSQVGESKIAQSNPSAPGVWQDVQQNELYRIPLE